MNNMCDDTKKEKLKTTAIVLAGGRGSRLKSDVPKQYLDICGHPLIYYCLKVFQDSFVDEIVLVCGEEDIDYCKEKIVAANGFSKVSKVVAGGKERYHSVYMGLRAVSKDSDIVFIHDGARPFINGDILERAMDETVKYGATVVAVPSKDTVKIADNEGFALNTPDRSSVYIMQTPQSFYYKEILDAYGRLIYTEQEVIEKGISITDDAMVMEYFGQLKVKFVMGDYRNIKITTPEDILVARAYILGE